MKECRLGITATIALMELLMILLMTSFLWPVKDGVSCLKLKFWDDEIFENLNFGIKTL